MANENYKCIFMGVLSNSITLSFLCNIISSTEAPGIESSGSKGNSHHAQIKVSSMISQHEHFSVNHFLSAGGIHCNIGKRRVSKHKEDCVTVLEKLVAEVMAPTVRNPPCLCGHHLQGHSGENWQRWGTHFLRSLSEGYEVLVHSSSMCSGTNISRIHRESHIFSSWVPAMARKITKISKNQDAKHWWYIFSFAWPTNGDLQLFQTSICLFPSEFGSLKC